MKGKDISRHKSPLSAYPHLVKPHSRFPAQFATSHSARPSFRIIAP